MPIAINPEHNDLADSVRSLVARVAPSEVLHEALETPIPNPPPYWKAAADQGLQGVHLAESVGGQGFGILELAIVLAEFGYGAVPGPFVPSAIASALISAHDPDAKLLADLASGATIAAYAIDSGLTATRHGDGLVIRGEVRAVPPPRRHRCWCCRSRSKRRTSGWFVDADQLEIEPVQKRRPAAAGGPRAGQRRRGRRRPRAVQPEPGRRACADVDAAVGGGDRRRTLGHRHRDGIRQDPRAVRQADRPVPGHQAQVRGDDRRRPNAPPPRCGMPPAPSTRRARAPPTLPTLPARTSSSPPRWPPRWRPPPLSSAPRTASRCTAASASPGSTTPTSTTAARLSWRRASAAPPTTRSASSTPRRRRACAASTSTWTPTPRSCATRSVRKLPR